MKCLIYFFGCCFLFFGEMSAGVSDYLRPQDQRFASFSLIEQLIAQRDLKVWVETGTARNGCLNCAGDGCSTIIFSDMLTRHPGELYSVDIDALAIHRAKSALKFSRDRVHFTISDSIKFLKGFPSMIDFLYLDSYDFEVSNPGPSQQHHLKEIEAAYPKLHQNSVVMIDDCSLPHGGKGPLAIKYLLERGWKILYKGYQVILVYDD